jgi:hypothetical protein
MLPLQMEMGNVLSVYLVYLVTSFVWQCGRLQCALRLHYIGRSKWSQMIAYLFLQFCVEFSFTNQLQKRKREKKMA